MAPLSRLILPALGDDVEPSDRKHNFNIRLHVYGDFATALSSHGSEIVLSHKETFRSAV